MDDLVRGLKAGDGRAYERLVAEYGDRVYRFIRRLAGPSEAEDLVQEVFLRIHRSAATYDPSGSFNAWVFTIANNLCLDHLRRGAGHRRTGPVDEETADPATGITPEFHEARTALRRAVAELPPDQKEVFLLREEAGLSFKEIAETLQCPLNTALGRMHYAMERLRKSLKAYRT